MRVFLTGGTGLLGSHLAEGLTGAGFEVGALCRPGSDTAVLESLGCDIVPGDLVDAPEAHARRMQGFRALVHAAGVLYGEASREETWAVNVEGTRKILDGARRARVERAVHVSSVAVYGNAPGSMGEGRPLDCPLPKRDVYGRSKREAEAVAWKIAGEGAMAVTILRPPALYGERDRYFLPRLLTWLAGPVVPLPGAGSNRLAAVYAGNLASAVIPVLEGRGGGDVFNVTEDVPVTLRALAEGLAGELGLRPRFIPIPAAVLKLGAWGAERLGLSVPGSGGLSPARALRLALEDNPYPAEKARRTLGWEPTFRRSEILARMGAWIRNRDIRTGG